MASKNISHITLYLTDCYTTSNSYIGTKSTTEYGITCQRWDTDTPHITKADMTFPPGETATDAVNYCRDPDMIGAPWCYTTDPNTRWRVCGIPHCNDL
jgi:apolipoprotein a